MTIRLCRCTLIGVVFLSSAFGSACITQSLANYETLGAGGCTVNNEPVFTFTFSVVSSTGSPTILSASQITVTPTFTAYSYTLEFSNASSGFSVSSNQSVQYAINFTWDPVVVGAEDDMFDPVTAPGSATVVTSLCEGALFSPGCGGTSGSLTVQDLGTSSTLTAVTSFSPVTVVDTQSTITLTGGSTGSAEITGFDNTVFTTPEPAAVGLVAPGFLGLWFAALSRRRGRRRALPTL